MHCCSDSHSGSGPGFETSQKRPLNQTTKDVCIIVPIIISHAHKLYNVYREVDSITTHPNEGYKVVEKTAESPTCQASYVNTEDIATMRYSAANDSPTDEDKRSSCFYDEVNY